MSAVTLHHTLPEPLGKAAHARKLGHKHRNAGALDSDDDDGGDGGDGGESFAVEPTALEGYRKRRRATLEER